MDGMRRTAPQPLKLPRLTREQVAKINLTCQFHSPVVLPGAAGFRLLLESFTKEVSRDALVSVRTLLGDRRMLVTLPRQLTTDLTQAMGNNIAVDKLPPDVAALMLEVSIVNLLMALEGATGLPVQLLELQDPPAKSLGIPLTLEGPDNAWPLFVLCDNDTERYLTENWPKGERNLDWLGVPLRARAGLTTLSLAAIQSLRHGDVILVETFLTAPGHLVLVAGERLCAIATLEGEQLSLAQDLQRQGGAWLMSDVEEGGDGDIDDLPVRLGFDVGRLDIPLGQMKQLAAGAVLDLGRAATGVVTISANGNRIGRGELVDVDGSLGVRIINLFTHDE